MDDATTVRYADLRRTAIYLGTTEKALRKLVEPRAIPFKRRKTRIFFDLAEVAQWAESLSVVSVQEAIRATGR